MMQNLFVYGTLLIPEILKKVTGREYRFVKAVLNGYCRFEVKECDYPAIIERKDGVVTGSLILNVDDSAMNALSVYEGDEYVKKEVEVFVNHSKFKAVVFVWCSNADKLTEYDWDESFFRQNKTENYS